MEVLKKIDRYLVMCSPIGALLYCIFTYLAITFYPHSFSPLEDYLSVLGNSSLNPQGAIFYNMGVISAGFSLFAFYIGIFSTYREMTNSKIMTFATLIGIFNGISIIMSGIFSEDVYDLHFFWSFMIFLSWLPVLLIINGMLMRTSQLVRTVSYFGLALGLFDTAFVAYVFMFGTNSGAIMEWITIFAFLGWGTLLSFVTSRRKNDKE